MNLTGFDYYSDQPDPTIGFTRTASLIRTARAEADGALVLLFDNGDALQGTPLGDQAAQDPDGHPMMQGFAALHYDAVGLGNHDFGFGLAVLDTVLDQAPCPVLCSNMRRRSGVSQRWQDHAVLDRSISRNGQDIPIRVGVLSVLPPQTAQWEAHHLGDDITVEDSLSAARRTVQILKSAGCDLVIALAHSGLGQDQEVPGLENAVIPLAAIDGIDALVAGHTHLTLPGNDHGGLAHVDPEAGLVHGKPVVMPGSAGSHLGVIDLNLSHSADLGWQVTDQQVGLRPLRQNKPTPETPQDPDMVRLFAPVHARTRTKMAEPVARIAQPMHSYFSFCAVDRGLALVASAQAAALRPYLSGTALANLPMLSAVSPYKCGGRSGPRYYTDVPAGEVCLRHIADLYVFPNELRAVKVSGAQVLDWLEMSAGLFNTLRRDAETDLIDPGRVGYNFDLLFGLTYQIDLSYPARFDARGQLIDNSHRRIRQARIDGSTLDPNQDFVVALNNYRANGGGHFPFVETAEPINLPAMEIKRILRDYLTGTLPADPLPKAVYPFSFTPQAGVQAILRTGPGALKYLSELQNYDPIVLDPDPQGFERIRLTL